MASPCILYFYILYIVYLKYTSDLCDHLSIHPSLAIYMMCMPPGFPESVSDYAFFTLFVGGVYCVSPYMIFKNEIILKNFYISFFYKILQSQFSVNTYIFKVSKTFFSIPCSFSLVSQFGLHMTAEVKLHTKD